jgi:hypothetical protein
VRFDLLLDLMNHRRGSLSRRAEHVEAALLTDHSLLAGAICGDQIGRGKIGAIFKRFVFKPEPNPLGSERDRREGQEAD